jgi:GH24 family phage-related lysozyme (muramidase)
LGYQTLKVTQDYYDGIVSDTGFRTLGQVIGVTGNDARDTINARADQLGAIRITKTQAGKVMPYVAVSYWKAITSRFPEVAADTTPPSVQTVMLSLAYNRGARNRDLATLAEPLEEHDWLGVADVVGAMQQDHQLPGIRIRRRQEADLIRHEMDFGT